MNLKSLMAALIAIVCATNLSANINGTVTFETDEEFVSLRNTYKKTHHITTIGEREEKFIIHQVTPGKVPAGRYDIFFEADIKAGNYTSIFPNPKDHESEKFGNLFTEKQINELYYAANLLEMDGEKGANLLISFIGEKYRPFKTIRAEMLTTDNTKVEYIFAHGLTSTFFFNEWSGAGGLVGRKYKKNQKINVKNENITSGYNNKYLTKKSGNIYTVKEDFVIPWGGGDALMFSDSYRTGLIIKITSSKSGNNITQKYDLIGGIVYICGNRFSLSYLEIAQAKTKKEMNLPPVVVSKTHTIEVGEKICEQISYSDPDGDVITNVTISGGIAAWADSAPCFCAVGATPGAYVSTVSVSDWASTGTGTITINVKEPTAPPKQKVRVGFSLGATPLCLGLGKMPLYTGMGETRISSNPAQNGGYDVTAYTYAGNLEIVGWAPQENGTVHDVNGQIASEMVPEVFWIVLENPDGDEEVWVEVDNTDGDINGDQAIHTSQTKDSDFSDPLWLADMELTLTWKKFQLGFGPYITLSSSPEFGGVVSAGTFIGSPNRVSIFGKLYSPSKRTDIDKFDSGSWTRNKFGAALASSYRFYKRLGAGLQFAYFKRTIENPGATLGGINLPTPNYEQDIFSVGIVVNFW